VVRGDIRFRDGRVIGLGLAFDGLAGMVKTQDFFRGRKGNLAQSFPDPRQIQ
jgi:hypothetical protein